MACTTCVHALAAGPGPCRCCERLCADMCACMHICFIVCVHGTHVFSPSLQDNVALDDAARAVGPGGAFYIPFNIALIVFFNYYYTFLQVSLTVVVRNACVKPPLAPRSPHIGLKKGTLAPTSAPTVLAHAGPDVHVIGIVCLKVLSLHRLNLR